MTKKTLDTPRGIVKCLEYFLNDWKDEIPKRAITSRSRVKNYKCNMDWFVCWYVPVGYAGTEKMLPKKIRDDYKKFVRYFNKRKLPVIKEDIDWANKIIRTSIDYLKKKYKITN